jgi:hypothetical protein
MACPRPLSRITGRYLGDEFEMGMAHASNSVAKIVYNNAGNKASTMPGFPWIQTPEITHFYFYPVLLNEKKHTKSFTDSTD